MRQQGQPIRDLAQVLNIQRGVTRLSGVELRHALDLCRFLASAEMCPSDAVKETISESCTCHIFCSLMTESFHLLCSRHVTTKDH